MKWIGAKSEQNPGSTYFNHGAVDHHQPGQAAAEQARCFSRRRPFLLLCMLRHCRRPAFQKIFRHIRIVLVLVGVVSVLSVDPIPNPGRPGHVLGRFLSERSLAGRISSVRRVCMGRVAIWQGGCEGSRASPKRTAGRQSSTCRWHRFSSSQSSKRGIPPRYGCRELKGKKWKGAELQ